MQKIKLTKTDSQIFVEAYYNENFVTKARNLKGNWQNGKWVFSTNAFRHVKAAMIECYGVTGEEPYETCTLEVKVNTYEDRGPVVRFGRTLARATGRDSGAKLGDDIFLVSGEIKSGGSVKNWMTIADNCVFEILEFPVAALQWERVQKALKEERATIVKD